MSFAARVFRILIASPSDVTDERELAVRAIQEWNDLNASERQIVLLPLRWETHSAPEYGKRPQEVINNQVVDHCDLVIGIFWTRIGSPTGVAESGTIEEIERVAAHGKRVMLYFSQANQNPEKIDIEQLARLRTFKKQTFPNALVESYGDQVEFKEKLSKQLEIQLRNLLAEQGEPHENREVPPVTDIVLHFSDAASGTEKGTDLRLETQFFELDGIDSLPDYCPSPDEQNPFQSPAGGLTQLWLTNLRQSEINKDYYRQRATSTVLQEFFRPLRFWLKNKGGVGARDVHIELTIQSDVNVICISRDALPSSPPSTIKTNYTLLAPTHPISPMELLSEERLSWRTSIEVKALQPQREVSPDAAIFVGAKKSSNLKITATIFADSLPEPIVQELTLRIDVTRVTAAATAITDAGLTPEHVG